MKKSKIVLAIISCFLVSCNVQNSIVIETCCLQIDNYGCTYEGLKDNYFVGENAEITFKVKNDLFVLPKKDNLKVYGSEEYTYDETTGKLNVKLNSNTGVSITANPRIGGRESSFGEVRKFSYANMPEHRTTAEIPFNKATVHWCFPSLNVEDKNQEFDLILIQAVLSNILEFEGEEFPHNLKEDKITIDINESMKDNLLAGYAILETTIHNNRIFIDPFTDCFVFNEKDSVAECLLHNCVSLATKDTKVNGALIWTIDNRDLITNCKVYFEPNNVMYKNFNLHIPGYLELSYFYEEVVE